MLSYLNNYTDCYKIELVLLALFFSFNSVAQEDIQTPIVGCSASASSSFDICASENKVYFTSQDFRSSKTIHSYDILAQKYDSIQIALPLIQEHFKYSLSNTLGVYRDSLIILGFGEFLFSSIYKDGAWSEVKQHQFEGEYIEYCFPTAPNEVTLILKNKRDNRFELRYDIRENLILSRKQMVYPFLFLSHLGPSRYINYCSDTVYTLHSAHFEIKARINDHEELSIDLKPYFKTKNNSYVKRIRQLKKLEPKMRLTMIELDSLKFDFLEEIYVSGGVYYVVYSVAGTGGKNTQRAVFKFDSSGNQDETTHFILEQKKVNILSPYFFSIGGELYSLAIKEKRFQITSLSMISRKL